MKNHNYLYKIISISMICLSLGCGDSGSSGGGSDGGGNSGSGGVDNSNTSGNACNSYKPLPNAYESAQRHVYIGEFRLDRDSNQQKTYRNFLSDFGLFCVNNSNSFKWQFNQYTGRWEYAYTYVAGASNCNNWDDFFSMWIIFPKNDSARAHLVIDSTMSGYFGTNGQGYDVKRTNIPNAQIDCKIEDRTVIYFEPNYNSQLRVNIYQGNKNSERLRAEVFYKNSSIGKTDFFIVE